MSVGIIRTVCIRSHNWVRNASFKSSISLENLYPQSTEFKKFVPPAPEGDKFSGYIPIEDLKITYTRASGPGGQHVNKTETKVDLRFHIQSAKWISNDIKQKIFEKHITKVNNDGYLVLRSERTRYKHMNLADAMTRLRTLIYALEVPEPVISEQTAEKIRKNKEKAARIRLMEKRQRSMTKSFRQTGLHDI